VHTINRMMITNSTQNTYTNGHEIKPIPRARYRPVPYTPRLPESSYSPYLLRPVPKAGRVRFDNAFRSPRGVSAPQCRDATIRRCNAHTTGCTISPIPSARVRPSPYDRDHNHPRAVTATIGSALSRKRGGFDSALRSNGPEGLTGHRAEIQSPVCTTYKPMIACSSPSHQHGQDLNHDTDPDRPRAVTAHTGPGPSRKRGRV